MHISILIPHYRNGKITAYAVSQLLKFKGDHQLDILVIDNSPLDGSARYLTPFMDDIIVFEYPPEKLQSHGIAFDYILPFVKTEYFITIESDGFPIREGWIDYYENLIKQGYECATSLLKLSGGTYNHPCGGLYKKSNWEEAKAYCEQSPYFYYPNMAMKEGFAAHLMIHKDILEVFLENPEDYVELSEGYRPFSKERAEQRRLYYLPATMPFHNGMGGRSESVHTYGYRTIESEKDFIAYDNRKKLLYRAGNEPGQWLSYWHLFMGKKIFNVPTEVKWLSGKEEKQQEYTLMENGFYHCWGVSSYHGHTPEGEEETAQIKQALPDTLYSMLPENQKI